MLPETTVNNEGVIQVNAKVSVMDPALLALFEQGMQSVEDAASAIGDAAATTGQHVADAVAAKTAAETAANTATTAATSALNSKNEVQDLKNDVVGQVAVATLQAGIATNQATNADLARQAAEAARTRAVAAETTAVNKAAEATNRADEAAADAVQTDADRSAVTVMKEETSLLVVNAQAAKDAAEIAQASAESSAQTAGISAQNAATSAGSASSSALAAAASAVLASDHVDAAALSASNAQTAATTAVEAKDRAVQAETTVVNNIDAATQAAQSTAADLIAVSGHRTHVDAVVDQFDIDAAAAIQAAETARQGAEAAAAMIPADGKNAYEMWQELPGNENKTFEEFLEHFRGENGETFKTQTSWVKATLTAATSFTFPTPASAIFVFFNGVIQDTDNYSITYNGEGKITGILFTTPWTGELAVQVWVDIAQNAAPQEKFYQFIDYHPKTNFWWTSEDPVRLRKADEAKFKFAATLPTPPAIPTTSTEYSWFGTQPGKLCRSVEIPYLTFNHHELPDRVGGTAYPDIKQHFFYFVPKTEHTEHYFPTSPYAHVVSTRSVYFLVAMPSERHTHNSFNFTTLKPPVHFPIKFTSPHNKHGTPTTLEALHSFYTSSYSTASAATVTATFATFDDLLELMPLGQVSMVYAEVIGGNPIALYPDADYPTDTFDTIGVVNVYVNGVKLTQDSPGVNTFEETRTSHHNPHPGQGNWLNPPDYPNALVYVPTPGNNYYNQHLRPHIVISAECKDILSSEEQIEILNKFNAQYYKG